jgi:hypothetical protein
MASGPVTFDEKKCDMTCFNTGCVAAAVLTKMILPTPSALKLLMFSLKSIRETQKEPPRYKRGGHWVNLFLLIAGFGDLPRSVAKSAESRENLLGFLQAINAR